MVPVLQIILGWWLPWHRPFLEKGRAVSGTWQCIGHGQSDRARTIG
jgi:hypothetical protein